MTKPRPNILLILTDQQRADTIQALGSRFAAATPHMDSLAQAGISFRNAFCTAPICSPSRATLLTGLYPTQAGMPGNLNAPSPPLSPDLPTVGKMLVGAGYQTAYHGKSHLGTDLQDLGFEVAEECSHDETTKLLASRFWKDRDWIENERPFFHIVSFLNPHDLYFYDPNPVEAEPGFERPWANAHRSPEGLPAATRGRRVDWQEERWGSCIGFYEELIERVDADIGETLHQLRCSGFFSNTWILFASDHGDMTGEHDLPFKGPFIYDGVARVPLIVVPPQTRFLGPGQAGTFAHDLEPGTRDQLCSLVDIVPTILDLAGIEASLPGQSLLDIVRNPDANGGREYVFAEWNNPGIRMIRSLDWKYLAHESGEEELFDLSTDSDELHNLASDPARREPVETLRKALREHLAAVGDPFASP